jgi:hypothetical protein
MHGAGVDLIHDGYKFPVDKLNNGVALDEDGHTTKLFIKDAEVTLGFRSNSVLHTGWKFSFTPFSTHTHTGQAAQNLAQLHSLLRSL